MSQRAVVLVVDDDASVRRSVGERLLEAGLAPIAAEDGLEAIDLAEQHRPRVVILDWEMPVLSGMEALPRLRRALPEACIVMFTPDLYSDRYALAARAGADGLIDKADGADTLIAFIRRFCLGDDCNVRSR